MVWTALALVLWVVLGGFISYYGDLHVATLGQESVFRWMAFAPSYTILIQ